MKFVNTNKLNDLHDDFEKHRCHEQDFQSFVEESMDEDKPVCVDTEEVRDALERASVDDYDYLQFTMGLPQETADSLHEVLMSPGAVGADNGGD